MRPTKREVEAELLRAVRALDRSMGRLSGFAAGSMGCWAVLEVWAWRNGSSPLLQGLASAVAVLGLTAGCLWFSARRRIGRWIRAVDARLGAGSGRALLELGSFQEGAFALEEGRQALTVGEKPKKG
jgi:hypothetical protein